MMSIEFELAEQFALSTRKHCFVTGKAGTGKTTLLKRLVAQTQKSVAVVAPTGVAAVNAGGVKSAMLVLGSFGLVAAVTMALILGLVLLGLVVVQQGDRP